MKKIISLSIVLAVALGFNACSTTGTEVKIEKVQKSLYDRLGGKKAITAVVYELWAVVSKDDRINHYFKHTKPEVFAGKLINQLCAGAGGPCEYKGMDMLTTHTGMNITEADFNALAEDVIKAMDKFNVPQKEKDEVMSMLGSMKADVVGH